MSKSKFMLDTDPDETEKLAKRSVDVDRSALKNFVKGANIHVADNITGDIPNDVANDVAKGKQAIVNNWQEEDPNELPSYNFRLRLNKYQIGLLKHAASLEKRSLSNMIKVILMSGLSNFKS